LSNICYLDNSATTKPCVEAETALLHTLREDWGNPSSLHSLGISAENIIACSKKAVANMLSCRDDEIFFTSGGQKLIILQF